MGGHGDIGPGVMQTSSGSKGGRPKKVDVERRQRAMHERQFLAAVWFATPDDLRQPATQEELAVLLGVTPMTIWRWRQTPDFQEAVRMIIIQNSGDPRRVAKVIDTLYEVAENVQHPKHLQYADLFLQATGVKHAMKGSAGNMVVNVDATQNFDLSEMTSDELESMLESMSGAIQEDAAISKARERLAHAEAE